MSIFDDNAAKLQQQNQQQQLQQMQQLSMIMNSNNFNPALLIQTDYFPDVLQYLTSEQSKLLLEELSNPLNNSLINKQGPLGGYTALHWMCIKNELDLIEYLVLKCNVDINCKASLEETPLFVCIKNCNLYAIEFLIQHGADLSHRDVYNRSLIHWAAYTGKVVLLYYFQQYHNINNLNDFDQFQQNALHIACASGFSDLIMYIINRGEIDYFKKDFNGNTCLHMAAKSGLARICWIITQQNKGECAKLIGMTNNQNQRPFDLIRNERGQNFKKIRDWLRLEAKTNKYLISSNELIEKKNENIFGEDMSLLKIKKGTKFFDWNSQKQMNFEWTIRFLSFFLIVTIPLLINKFLLYPTEMSLMKGLVGYSTFIFILLVVVRQKHRISHISGLENPYFIGFISSLFIHNYSSFYFYVFGPFSITRFYDVFIVSITIWHLYSFYKILITNPGFCKENFKKPDGTPYELRDLLRTNMKEAKSGKDSINWLIEPPSFEGVNKPIQLPQLYFCENCLIVQALPTKHCKLCEGCCSKFDHHCLFINKCVGLKNHREFIIFIVATLMCSSCFLYSIYCYFMEFNQKLNILNNDKKEEDKIDLFYTMFSSTIHIWLIVLALVNCFITIMVFFLLAYQIKFVSLGYTTQFRPPIFFAKTNKRMSTLIDSIRYRIENMYIFLFESCEANEELYFRQQRDYSSNVSKEKSIDNDFYPDPYPRDNFDNRNKFIKPFESIENNSNSNYKQYEIDLD